MGVSSVGVTMLLLLRFSPRYPRTASWIPTCPSSSSSQSRSRRILNKEGIKNVVRNSSSSSKVTSSATIGTGFGSRAAQQALADPFLRRFRIGGFELESGEVLPPNAELAYRVYSQNGEDGGSVWESSSSKKKKGIILHPTSFDAVHTELEYQIGPGNTLDTNQYTVIVPNMLGNGVSFSPSTMAKDETPGSFPHVTVGDNVRLQKKLLQEGLGYQNHPDFDVDNKSLPFGLRLIYGYSMGALQAYEWSMRYPESVEGIAVVCGASHCSEINEVFLSSLEAALKADPSWCKRKGMFVRHPVGGLRAFATIYAGWGVGTSYYANKSYMESGYRSADDFVKNSYIPAFQNADANDLLAQIRTWKTANTSLRSTSKEDHNLQGALMEGTIQADVLLMPCDTDRYFTIEASQREADLLMERRTPSSRVLFRPIRSTSGHRAGDPHRPELTTERDHIRTNVHEFLALLERK